jgi:hypothetical protein
MTTLFSAERRKFSIEPVLRWWRGWTGRGSLGRCGEDEVERMARDVGVSAAELRTLATRRRGSADLLLRRMAALDLDRGEIARAEPATFRDLQKVCSLCRSRRRCVRDMAHDINNPRWQEYCPNATTLKALDAMPGLRGASGKTA